MLYRYKCHICGREIEEFRKVEDREKEKQCCSAINYEEQRGCQIILGREQCKGKLIFQPVYKPAFHFKGVQYKT